MTACPESVLSDLSSETLGSAVTPDMCSALSLSFPFCCCKKYISHAFQRVLGSSPTGPFSSRSTTRSKGEKAKGQEHHPHQQHKCGPWRKTRLKRKGCPQPGLQTQTRGRRRMGSVPAALHTHACGLSPQIENTEPVPASRGFTPWCRSRTAKRGLLAPRGRPAVVHGPARRPAPHCICVPLHAAEPVLPVGLAASCGCALCLVCECEVCAVPVCTKLYTFLLG